MTSEMKDTEKQKNCYEVRVSGSSANIKKEEDEGLFSAFGQCQILQRKRHITEPDLLEIIIAYESLQSANNSIQLFKHSDLHAELISPSNQPSRAQSMTPTIKMSASNPTHTNISNLSSSQNNIQSDITHSSAKQSTNKQISLTQNLPKVSCVGNPCLGDQLVQEVQNECHQDSTSEDGIWQSPASQSGSNVQQKNNKNQDRHYPNNYQLKNIASKNMGGHILASGPAKVITIKKKDQTLKLIDKLIVKAKPAALENSDNKLSSQNQQVNWQPQQQLNQCEQNQSDRKVLKLERNLNRDSEPLLKRNPNPYQADIISNNSDTFLRSNKNSNNQGNQIQANASSHEQHLIKVEKEKQRIHLMIHERIDIVHRRHEREKRKKYHCLHAFHAINCHSFDSNQGEQIDKSIQGQLRRMDYLSFIKYFRSKLERASSPSLEQEFLITSPNNNNPLLNSKTKNSVSQHEDQNGKQEKLHGTVGEQFKNRDNLFRAGDILIGTGDSSRRTGDTQQEVGETQRGAGYISPGTGDGTGDTKRGVGDTQRGTRDTQRETGDILRGAGDNLHGKGDTKRGTRDNQHGTGYILRTGDNQRKIGDNLRGSGDNSRRTGDNFRGSGDNQRRTGDNLRGTGDNLRGSGDNLRGSGDNLRDTGDKQYGNRDNSPVYENQQINREYQHGNRGQQFYNRDLNGHGLQERRQSHQIQTNYNNKSYQNQSCSNYGYSRERSRSKSNKQGDRRSSRSNSGGKKYYQPRNGGRRQYPNYEQRNQSYRDAPDKYGQQRQSFLSKETRGYQNQAKEQRDSIERDFEKKGSDKIDDFQDIEDYRSSSKEQDDPKQRTKTVALVAQPLKAQKNTVLEDEQPDYDSDSQNQ